MEWLWCSPPLEFEKHMYRFLSDQGSSFPILSKICFPWRQSMSAWFIFALLVLGEFRLTTTTTNNNRRSSFCDLQFFSRSEIQAWRHGNSAHALVISLSIADAHKHSKYLCLFSSDDFHFHFSALRGTPPIAFSSYRQKRS
jgi:hypothetical protein